MASSGGLFFIVPVVKYLITQANQGDEQYTKLE